MFNVNIIDKDINHTKHINSIKFSQKYVENSPNRPECGEFCSDFYFVCTYGESGIIDHTGIICMNSLFPTHLKQFPIECFA